MADARRSSLWDHTAQVLMMIANVNRDPQRIPEPFRFDQFHPFCDKPFLPTLAELPDED